MRSEMQPGPSAPYPPPPYAPDPRREDDEHVKLLVVFHYVMAGLIGLFALLPLIYVAMGVFFVAGGGPMSAPGAPRMVGWLFIAVGGIVCVVGESLALLTFFAARALSARRNWTFCMVVASLNTLHAPLGTALGVFTLIVLMRSSVKATFQSGTDV